MRKGFTKKRIIQRYMLNISQAVRKEIHARLEVGDQLLIIARLQEKGLEVHPSSLNQFLSGRRPMKTIGIQVVEEATALFRERATANQQALQSLQALAA